MQPDKANADIGMKLLLLRLNVQTYQDTEDITYLFS